jgi:hypothetical protein
MVAATKIAFMPLFFAYSAIAFADFDSTTIASLAALTSSAVFFGLSATPRLCSYQFPLC